MERFMRQISGSGGQERKESGEWRSREESELEMCT